MANHRRSSSTPFGFRTADAALAVVVVAIVALMVVPLPTWLLDILLAGNLAFSVAVLLVTLYVGSALEISAFPTLLLITTLVRVALNVSSTRLILLHADAGAVIRAFGTFVVSGNFAVGAVIFLILTIIQFVVVAKGSERVAEVGARFTLDALPGKQLSIDADLRAGNLEPGEAQRLRRELERESHFYGAMDGAVKFVKGDVIATVLIAIVNLVGGVAIGVGQRGLDFGAALRRFGLLTIGDGLVTQIPALLLATSAGILVTRVASDDPRTALGSELSAQLLGVPRALGVAGVLVLGFALVPGLPTLPFLVIGIVLIALSRRGPARSRYRGPAALHDAPANPITPWSLAASAGLAARIGARALDELAERLRSGVERERGVPLPECRVFVDDGLAHGAFVLSIHEVPALVRTASMGVSDESLVRSIEEECRAILLDRASDFVGISETKALLDGLERIAPTTVRQIVPRVVDVADLSEVLRRLVGEGVSIRDLKAILEALPRARPNERDPASLAEHVRAELKRPLTFTLMRGAPELGVILLDPGVEEAIRSAISNTSSGRFLAMAPAAARDIVSAVRRAIECADSIGREHPIVLTRPDIRRFVRHLLEAELPRVRVVSFAELLPEVTIAPRARATLAGL